MTVAAKQFARVVMNSLGSDINLDQFYGIKNFLNFLNSHQESIFYAQLKVIDEHLVKQKFSALIDQFNLPTNFKVLIDILVKEGVIYKLPKIIRQCLQLAKDKLNLAEFTIITSHELPQSYIDRLVNTLELKTHKKVIYTTKIDKKLIAGIKVYSDNMGFEHSIQQQLNLLNYEH